MTEGVVLAHDYSTQRGGAERVALWFAAAFPGSPMYTTLYDPRGTFAEFTGIDLHTSVLNRFATLRHNHRLALPFLAAAVSRQRIEAEVLLASSSGWAHGYRGAKRTVVYCHAPARWLYQRERYLGLASPAGPTPRDRIARAVLTPLAASLRRWDRDAAHRADLYLANSTVTKRAIRETYGIEAEVLPPPPALLPDGEVEQVEGIEPGFLLCVARLLPYKNVDQVIEAAQSLGRPLVVIGDGPDRARLARLADRGGAVHLLGRVSDARLRWAYRNAAALVAAAHEDYGLTPLEAGAFGRPAVALRDAGYQDTVVEDATGIFFDEPTAASIAAAVEAAERHSWDTAAIEAHVRGFAPARFVARLRELVERQRALAAALPGPPAGSSPRAGAPRVLAGLRDRVLAGPVRGHDRRPAGRVAGSVS